VRPGRDAAWYRAASAGLEAWQCAQEYPADPDEAFILSGRPRFDVDALRAIMAGCREPLQTTQDSGGTLLVWEEPQLTHRYTIGADPAEGLLKGDFSVAVVLDVITGTEVAAARGKWEPTTFARLLADLGWQYRSVQNGVATPALLGVEKNNHGHAVLLALADYPNLYRHQEYDATASGESARVGWLSTTRSKPLMIDGLAAAIRERRPYRWRQFVEEALRYCIMDDGKTAASGDYHDDVVTAMAIAEQMRLWVPTLVHIVSMAHELGSVPATTLDPALALAGGGWTITNDFGRTINPWGPSGFAGAVDDRY
jgi:hypothetical protein